MAAVGADTFDFARGKCVLRECGSKSGMTWATAAVLTYSLFCVEGRAWCGVLQDTFSTGDGTELSLLTRLQAYPGSPTTSVTLTTDYLTSQIAASTGLVWRGYLVPPVAGFYKLAISAGGQGDLWLGDGPAEMTKIASSAAVPEGVYDSRSQTSVPQYLDSSRRYYLEARAQIGVDGGHLSLQVETPSGKTKVLPVTYFQPGCALPVVANAKSPSCQKASIGCGEVCVPQCEEGYEPSVTFLHCTLGELDPPTFACLPKSCPASFSDTRVQTLACAEESFDTPRCWGTDKPQTCAVTAPLPTKCDALTLVDAPTVADCHTACCKGSCDAYQFRSIDKQVPVAVFSGCYERGLEPPPPGGPLWSHDDVVLDKEPFCTDSADLPIGNSPYTLEAYVDHDKLSVVGWGDFSGGVRKSHELRLHGTSMVDSWGGPEDLSGTSAALATGSWHHVAATFDGQTRRLYVDYQLVGKEKFEPVKLEVETPKGLCVGTRKTKPVYEFTSMATGGKCQQTEEGAKAKLPMGNSPYTLEAWIMPEQHDHGVFLMWGDYATNKMLMFRLDPPNKIFVAWYNNDLYSEPVANLNDRRWHHVATTWDGEVRRLYVDFRQVGEDRPKSPRDVTNSANFCLTDVPSPAASTNPLTGQIKHVKIWPKARTVEEMRDGGGPGKIRLVKVWKEARSPEQMKLGWPVDKPVAQAPVFEEPKQITLDKQVCVGREGGAASDLPLKNDPYTIEAWIRPTKHEDSAIVAWGKAGTANTMTSLRLERNGIVSQSWWGMTDLQAKVGDLADGAWHHVAATFDGGTRRIFVDFKLSAEDAPGSHAAAGPESFCIGHGEWFGERAKDNSYFNGEMKEVRVWKVARTSAEMQGGWLGPELELQTSLIATGATEGSIPLVTNEACLNTCRFSPYFALRTVVISGVDNYRCFCVNTAPRELKDLVKLADKDCGEPSRGAGGRLSFFEVKEPKGAAGACGWGVARAARARGP
jgi:hypothetical protein